MTDEEARLLLHASLDGELDASSAVGLERRLAEDASLRAERDRLVALRQALRERVPAEAAPEHLRQIVLRATASPRKVLPAWRALAASVLVSAALGSGVTYLAMHGSGADAVEAVIAGHVRALAASQPTDIASSDRHTVKPWFNGRVAFAPKVLDLADEGFPLVGGRIDVIDGRPAATLVYRHRQHLISVTAAPLATRGHVALSPSARDGFNLQSWTEDGLAYWTVSDLGRADFDRFAALFRARR